MEEEIRRMEAELQDTYGKQDWSMTFRAGPDAIAILAECILITARPIAIVIELKGPGLEYAKQALMSLKNLADCHTGIPHCLRT